MSEFDILPVTRAGVLEDQVATAGKTLAWANTGFEILDLKNNTGSAQKTLTLAFNSASKLDGQTIASHTLTIAAETSYVMGPFDPLLYNDVNGRVNFTVSSTTLLSACVFRLSTNQSITLP